ncbi:hypothetical protein KAR91_53525 [Candidatus Pacearchaeota archaeon]|nr:hypothetical protein [Candidatus Pacearchaeota archaeon]
MREILVKAICIETGEWVMGNLIQNAVYDTAIYDCNEMEYCGVEVDEETVCQFINKKDAKGAKIFGGDCIEWYSVDYWEQRSFPEYVDCSGYSVIRYEGVVTWSNADSGWAIVERSTYREGVEYSYWQVPCSKGVDRMSAAFDKCLYDTPADEIDGDISKIGTVKIIGNIHDKDLK